MNSRGAEKVVSNSRFRITLRGKVVYVNMTYVLERVYISCMGNKGEAHQHVTLLVHVPGQ
jgi:hypothetical protein